MKIDTGKIAGHTRIDGNSSLFKEIGGSPAINATVEVFYDRVLSDQDLMGFFEGVDIISLKNHQRYFLGAALGGGNDYLGRTIRSAHERLVIERQLNDAHFDSVAGHLEASLRLTGIPADLTARIMKIVEGLRDDVLSK